MEQLVVAITANGEIYASTSSAPDVNFDSVWFYVTKTKAGLNSRKNYLGIASPMGSSDKEIYIPDDGDGPSKTRILVFNNNTIDPDMDINLIPYFTIPILMDFNNPTSKIVSDGRINFYYIGESNGAVVYKSMHPLKYNNWNLYGEELFTGNSNEKYTTITASSMSNTIHLGTNLGSLVTLLDNGILNLSNNIGTSKFKNATCMLNDGSELIVPMENKLFKKFSKSKGWLTFGNIDLTDNTVPEEMIRSSVNGVYVLRDRYSLRWGTNMTNFQTVSPIAGNTTYVCNKIKFLNNRFIALFDGGKLFYSNDGITWTQISYAFNGANLKNIEFRDNGAYVVTTDSGTLYCLLNGNITQGGWAAIPIPNVVVSDPVLHIVFAMNKWVIISLAGRVWTSYDGISWTYIRQLGYSILNAYFLYDYVYAIGANSNVYRSFFLENTWTTAIPVAENATGGFKALTKFNSKIVFLKPDSSLTVGTLI